MNKNADVDSSVFDDDGRGAQMEHKRNDITSQREKNEREGERESMLLIDVDQISI